MWSKQCIWYHWIEQTGEQAPVADCHYPVKPIQQQQQNISAGCIID